LKYRIVITVFEPNPTYAAEMEEFEKRTRYSNSFTPPVAEREVKKLETVMDEDEFLRMRDAVLEQL
jgi:hypothetical protein